MKVRVRKRDTHGLWFKHLFATIVAILSQLEPEQSIVILINGRRTVWRRMRPSAGRPTPGVKIAEGREVWELIPLGDEFDLEIPDGGGNDDVGPEEPRPVPLPARNRPELPLLGPANAGRLADAYEIADYSGSLDKVQQRRAIRVAYAEADDRPLCLDRPFTRESLLMEMLGRLRRATEMGMRLVLGQDHQYSIPYGLAQEIGLGNLDWRQALDSLVQGTYGPGAPPLAHARTFARRFNDWLVGLGRQPYFWSATKPEYGLPTTNPRDAGDPAVFRLTECFGSIYRTGSPMPFNRVGDNGSVGGQTLVGLGMLRQLLIACEDEGIPLRCWPFDGLNIQDPVYDNAHVLMEPYPSASRALLTPEHEELYKRSRDAKDALAALLIVQQADRDGLLPRLLDLTGLTPEEQTIVRFEGWIIGHTPLRRRR